MKNNFIVFKSATPRLITTLLVHNLVFDLLIEMLLNNLHSLQFQQGYIL